MCVMRIAVLAVLLVYVVTGEHREQSSNGRAFIWESVNSNQEKSTNSNVNYHSRSLVANDAAKILLDHAQNSDVVAILKPATTVELISSAAVKASVKSSPSANIFTSVRCDASDESESPLQDAYVDQLNDIKKVSLSEFESALRLSKEGKNRENNFEVTITAEEIKRNKLQTLFVQRNKRILFVVYDEPSAVKGANQMQLGHYDRILSTTSDDTVYYTPEGTEFSIYYADTYLYITPDIVTALLTGLFMFFAALIGLCCMNNIEGVTVFYDKCPTVGKEA